MLRPNGWALLAYPLFIDQLTKLSTAVGRAKRANPANWRGNRHAKLFEALRLLVLERVPADPFDPGFRQGNTMGAENRHWLRAKFGGNRFRLFFRADSTAQVIVYAWVNDDDTLQKSGASTDPYAVFAGMLGRGHPPGDWTTLLAASRPLEIPDLG